MTRLTGDERAVLRELSGGMPGGLRPYGAIAEAAGLTEDGVIEIVRGLIEKGVIRRVSAIVHDGKLGYGSNAMIVWRVPPEKLDSAGAAAAARSEISHAYSRETPPGWPYNLYTMVHARSREAVAELVEELAPEIGATEHRALFTVREFTKRRPKYSPLWDDEETRGE